MARRVLFDDAARAALARGVERLAGAVAVTLGPSGRNVVLAHADGSIAITNDGATVAREIELPDPFENLGARLVREAAQKTGEDVGDGTTTSVVLAHALFRRAAAAVNAGASPPAVRRGIDRGVLAAVESLRAQARPLVDEADRAAVAAVAAGGDAALGHLVAAAFDRVGPGGTVLVEEGHGTEPRLRFVEGLRFERGWVSAYFVTAAEEMRVDLERPLVLLARDRLTAAPQVLPAVERAVAARRPLLVIAHEITDEALALLVVNQLRGGLRACAVAAPDSGDRRDAWLADLAAVTGARVLGDEAGLDPAHLPADALGEARRVHVERAATTLFEAPGRRAAVLDHVERPPPRRGHRVTAASIASAWPSASRASPAASPRSRSAPPANSRSTSEAAAPRTPSAPCAPRSPRASSPAGASRWSAPPRPSRARARRRDRRTSVRVSAP